MRCFSKAERHASDDSQLNTLARLQLALLNTLARLQLALLQVRRYQFVYVAAAGAAGVAPLAPTHMAKAGARRCETWDAKWT